MKYKDPDPRIGVFFLLFFECPSALFLARKESASRGFSKFFILLLDLTRSLKFSDYAKAMTTSPQLRSQLGERPQRKTEASRHWLWLAFSLAAVLAIGLFFIPAFIIRPFRHQSPRALLIAMALRQRAPIGTLITGLVCLAMAFVLWRTATTLLRKSFIAVVIVLVVFSAAMSRLNYFEWMFHPIDSAQFLAQSESKLDSKEMIMAVRFASDARAYPISQMAYHHVLNDVVAGTPIVVTY
jgi:hypothetical protein